MTIRQTAGERMFDSLNILTLLLLSMFIMAPMLHVLAGSLSSNNALIHSQVKLWPVGFNWDNYMYVMQNERFWNAFGVTVFVVLAGTMINLVLTVLTAYPLSKTGLKGRKGIVLFILITMIFQAPLVPYFLVVKSLGLINTVWSLIIPGALDAFLLILCVTFFRSLPEELFEAARVDGMSEYSILFKVAVPISLPIIYTLTLFYAVGHWNNFYSAQLFITKIDIRPLQLYMYNMINGSSSSDFLTIASESAILSPEGLKMATIMVATIPIIIMYPLIQKHFIKGAMIGSLKE